MQFTNIVVVYWLELNNKNTTHGQKTHTHKQTPKQLVRKPIENLKQINCKIYIQDALKMQKIKTKLNVNKKILNCV